MALLGPMGMIFVPSVGGVSHSPKELTHWEDCARGADVLLRTVLEMDRVVGHRQDVAHRTAEGEHTSFPRLYCGVLRTST